MLGENKVFWREGLFLTPQHFQALTQYSEFRSYFLYNLSNPFHWGFKSIEIDEEAIKNWEFIVKSLEVVFKDGSTLKCPHPDNVPPSRTFQDIFPGNKTSALVYLGIPKEDVSQPNVKMADDKSYSMARYESIYLKVNDYNTGSNPREIEFLTKKPVILFEGEPLDKFDYLPIGEIVIKNVGQPSLSSTFIPPCLTISASKTLVNLINSLYREVTAISNQLRKQLSYGKGDKTINLTLPDIPLYLKSRELLGMLPYLKMFFNNPSFHPVELYIVLSSFFTQLSILFDIMEETSFPEQIPDYDHQNSSKGFLYFESKLKQILMLAVKTREGEIILNHQDDKDHLWQGSLKGIDLTGVESFYLWVAADMEDERLKSYVINDKEIKLGTGERLNHLLVFGLPGIELTLESHPPTLLPAINKGFYFRLNTNDELWREVIETQEISILGRKEIFHNLQIKLHFLKR